nr:integrase, catalytic region, zinc finger, CCHC-type, peptidase aspartic, catalytic [Tanacetum cinerariifolium]
MTEDDEENTGFHIEEGVYCFTHMPKELKNSSATLQRMMEENMTGDRSQLINFVHKFLGTIKFGNDHLVKIMGYGNYKIGNVTILRVYFMERLGHNLLSVGQFYDSDLEVAFRQHTCFIRNVDGVDLLTGSQGNDLYTLSLQDMMASSLSVCCPRHPRPSLGFGIAVYHI